MPINNKTATKNSNFNQRVNTVKGNNVNTFKPKVVVNATRPKVVLNAVKGNQVNAVKASACWVWKPKTKVIDHVSKHNSNPQQDLEDKGVINSGCSRHMTGNMSYLIDFEEIYGGYVAFGGNPKGAKITGKATKDETSDILKSFINRVENLTDQKVKVIRCDNINEFKNKEMNQFCERKGIKRKFSVARTPQQNGVAKRKNRTLIEVAMIMLADFKLPTTFWAEAVNTACYVQNRVLVTKPHNKTPYELFLGRKLDLSFIKPFRRPVTILNTIDHLGKFDGKADEGFFVGYSINSKAFRVLNNRTRIVEENLHVQFSENTPNIVGSGPNWLFDIDALTKSMNYKPVIAENQSNGNAGTKACDDAGKARMEIVPNKDYILVPLWTTDTPFSQISKSSPDDGFKPSSDEGKKVDEDPNSEGNDQVKEDNVNSTNNVNAASTNEVNAGGGKTSIELLDDLDMHELEDIVYSDIGAEADMNNLNTFMPVSPIPTTRIHKDHPVEQIIGDFNTTPQIRRMTKNLEEHDGCQERFSLWFQRGTIDKTLFIRRDKGLQVKQKEDGIFISQDKYVTEILKKFGFIDVKTASTSMETQKPLLKDEDGEEVDVHLYRSIIGSLMYLTSLRPDIMFAVCQPKLGLWYPKDSPFDLVSYTDSDYARASLDRKSTIGVDVANPIKYALTVNPTIYTSCIEQFWATAKVKIVNEEEHLQALVDKKKVIIIESTIRRDLHLEDVEGTDYLPNATIFEQLALMGYEKLSQKLTFYKAFFSPQ
ncbi:ribonuclease H-like domain-containing protein [Tanacetum coccineum]